MTDRNELLSLFGPLLMEAVVIITMDEINILRKQLGLKPRKFKQLLKSINSKLDTLPLYDWMTTEF